MFSIGIQGNPDEYRRELDALGRQVLPKALATTITRAAWKVRDRLVAYTKSGAIEKPRVFTTSSKAWKVTPANASDGDNMKAEIKAQDIQAQYLWWIIMGGTRSAGDAGTGRHDILFWSRRKTPQGGAYNRKLVEETTAANKQEKRDRRAWRASSRAARAAHGNTVGPIARDLRWIGRPEYKPGMFYGTVGGVEGYYQRPERLTAVERFERFGRKLEHHHRDVESANRILARGNDLSAAKRRIRDAYDMSQRGEVPKLKNFPWTKPGSKVKLLMAFKVHTHHRAFFDYDGEMLAAYNEHVNATTLAASIRYHKTRVPRP
ncbi:hypothetical protein O9X99_02085 [Agrobacterium salinitolerans]|uniref:Uncharacterized protein n=1 Tax=Agrobacterium salinitolerans TaxID=1183413 RepID=A0ABY3BWR1_9HYPH|nr:MULTISPECIES: hypothetical protein [Agrobacterium]MCZ7890457.1 hypothetical protein [Agrobacterium salinitolerans]TRA96821.1 hypothetical protein EXN23_00870 [Agrobacterium salinitolerans]